MDILLVLLVTWVLFSVYKSIKVGAYIYIVYLVVFYFILGLFITGIKSRIFLTVVLSSLLNTGIIITNIISTISKILSSTAKST